MEVRIGKSIIRTIQGDITELSTDAIVNAANPTLMGGGGVDGAIHRKGGPRILEECKKIREKDWQNGLPTGKAVITTGGLLEANYVIHTVGPVWKGGSQKEDGVLASAYQNSMMLVIEKGLKSIAFPSISTGAYGYPIERASRVAIKAVKEFLEGEDELDEVIFVLFSKSDLEVYEEALKEVIDI